jgi:SAM-dependent methyltransferase
MTVPVSPDPCHVCSRREFAHTPVLWTELVSTWGLADQEAEYIDVQQGTHCVNCGSNVRSIALARAILRSQRHEGPLFRFVRDGTQANLRVLEINEAGTLHPVLRMLPRHRLVSYPDVDMSRLPFADGSFDLVVHSDTLEHLPDPGSGLRECRRVLDAGGAMALTVPTVLGRLTRSRAGLPASYHGAAGRNDPHMLVHTEFGADVWVGVFEAGFTSCELVTFHYPAGLAIIARHNAP